MPVTRASGESVFTIHNGEIFTSPVILGAESGGVTEARTQQRTCVPCKWYDGPIGAGPQLPFGMLRARWVQRSADAYGGDRRLDRELGS